MSITVTGAGSAATSGGGGPGQTLALPAYNQASGHCIVIGVGVYASTPAVTITDTAGNNANYAPLFGGGISVPGTPSLIANIFICPNCVGNAANIVTINYTNGSNGDSFATYQDIGGCLASPLDATSSGTTTDATSLGVTGFSTAQANEALILFQYTITGYNTTLASSIGSVDEQNGQGGNQGGCAHAIFSSIQNNITPGFNITPANAMIVLAATFKASAAGGGNSSWLTVALANGLRGLKH